MFSYGGQFNFQILNVNPRKGILLDENFMNSECGDLQLGGVGSVSDAVVRKSGGGGGERGGGWWRQ